MKKKHLLIMVLATVALAAGYWAGVRLYSAPTGGASDMELADLEGQYRSLKTWQGKVLLVNFWATWCAPCREEIPLLIELQERYKARGLQVVGIALDEREAVVPFRRQLGINYPILIGQDEVMALMGRYGNRIGSLPFSVLIDRHGHIAARKLGIYQRAELETLIQPLLPSGS